MTFIHRLVAGLRALFWRSRADRELDVELHASLDEANQATKTAGLRGNFDVALIGRDARLACRLLRRSPGFAASAILTLAVGIGACTAMFSVVRAVLLRPFGITAPGRVVVLWPEANGTPGEFAFNAASRLNEGVSAFDEVALVASVNSDSSVTIRGGEPFQVSGSLVSAAFFDVLGARPLLGRTLRATDDRPTSAPVMVLSYGLWQRRFGGDQHVLGRQATVDSDTCEVVGVMPREFFFPNGAEYLDAGGAHPGKRRRALQHAPGSDVRDGRRVPGGGPAGPRIGYCPGPLSACLVL